MAVSAVPHPAVPIHSDWNATSYDWPTIDACSAKRSFELHARRAEQSNVPFPDDLSEELQETLHQTEAELNALRFWPNTCPDFELNFEAMFQVALNDLDMDSVPGNCSLNRLGTTNREVFKYDGENYDPERVSLVRLAVWDRFNNLVSGNLQCDPIKVFVKQEPHKRKKLDEGRLRLISSVSLIDTIIDRILSLIHI